MREVKIKKIELLEKVKTNRRAHEAEYVAALKGYRQEATDQLRCALFDAENGGPVKLRFDLDAPISQVKEYDRVIAMLEMSTEDVIVLSSHEFQQYVLDDWSWKELASSTNARYLK